MIRILLAEDHHLVRKGIRALLEKTDDIEVIGEVENGKDAVDFVHKNRPDVVVMDINMPHLNGIQATEQIRSANLSIHIVILSMYSDESIVRQAIRAGAEAYLLKRSLAEELVLAIHSVQQGDVYLSPGISRILLDKFVEGSVQTKNLNPLNALTARERQIMQLIAEGNTTKAIALQLGVSDKTIEKHRTSLMAKLDINDISAVVRMAIKYGLIFLDE